MPCKDTTSQVIIKLDIDERLVDFDYAKITCSKEIGGGTGFKEYCAGRSIGEISELEFTDMVEVLELVESEDQFFLYLEWDALTTAIDQYRGKQEGIDPERYRIASITHDTDGIEICQVIRPLKDVPKIIPCRKRAAMSPDQSE